MLSVLLVATQAQGTLIPSGRISFENHLVSASLPATPCWFVSCKNPQATLLPPIRGNTFDFDYTKKQRILLGEQQFFDAPVFEELWHSGKLCRFVYCESSKSEQQQLASHVMAPLVQGANYLVWSCAFDGVSSDSSTFMRTAVQEFRFKIPEAMRNNSLRLGRGRVRTASQSEPKNDVEMIVGILNGIAVGGPDSRDAVNFFPTIPRSFNVASGGYLRENLPKDALKLRDKSIEKGVRAAYSYIAQYFGGREYRKVWLDDLSLLSYDVKEQVDNSVLSAFGPDTMRWRPVDFGSQYDYSERQYQEYIEPNDQALARFMKTKDEKVRMILASFLVDPGNDADAKKWIPVFVRSTESTWPKTLALKLSTWLKEPGLSPGAGIPLDGLRQKYREIYGIDQ
jgi:hypothetical protein